MSALRSEGGFVDVVETLFGVSLQHYHHKEEKRFTYLNNPFK